MKRVTQLKALSSEHHRALVLARKARLNSAKDSTSVSDMWTELENYFKSELERHFTIEELHIGKHLNTLGESALIKRLHEEHQAMRSFFLPESGRSSNELKNFADLLEKHVRFEERELFEVAQNRLSPDILCEIDKACNRKTSLV